MDPLQQSQQQYFEASRQAVRPPLRNDINHNCAAWASATSSPLLIVCGAGPGVQMAVITTAGRTIDL